MSKLKWIIWEDPEDNSLTTTLVGAPHYGTDQAYQVKIFETEADTIDEHFEQVRRVHAKYFEERE